MNVTFKNEKVKPLTLKLGDIITKNNSQDETLVCVVVKNCKRGSEYSVANMFEDINGYYLTAPTLEILTIDALKYGYRIYSQDKYDIIIQPKDC